MEKTKIPMDERGFQRIIQFYLLECPVRVFNRIGKSKESMALNGLQTHPKYNYHFIKVSRRGITFADRNLDGPRLNAFRAAMKRVAATNIVLQSCDSVQRPETSEEYLVVKTCEGRVSITEGYFYCVRNALAHGGFSVDEQGTYLLENFDKGTLKGVGRIKESTLLKWIDLFNMDYESIRNAGK